MSISRIHLALVLCSLTARATWAQSPISASDLEAFTQTYCAECHNSEDWAGSLAFDLISSSDIHSDAEIWEKVIRKLRVGMMPPPEATHIPSAELRQTFVGSLAASLDSDTSANPNPGPALIRRLNRAEYQNAIRDVLNLEVDTASLLPPDDSAHGFDNNAEALGTSPMLVEQYLTAAGKISALAVGDPETGPSGFTFRIRQDASQDIPVVGMPVGTVGGGMLHTVLPLDGEYQLDVRFFKSNLGAMKGLELPHEFEITVDGERVHLATIGGTDDFNALMRNITEGADAVEARSSTVLKLPAGPHDIGVGFVYRGATQNSHRLQAFLRSSQDLLDVTGHPHVETLTITGPYNVTGSGDTPSRRQIFTCRPVSADTEPDVQELGCASEILSRLARKAYRGKESVQDIDILMSFFEKGRARRGFEFGIQTAIERMLTSPKFTFRVEQHPEDSSAAAAHQISNLDLATRLSFFLWSSVPDETLLDLADKTQLSDPGVLDQQVRRMLADPKARALVDNFAGQWLYLRNLKSMVPNSSGFPDFDDNLRQGLLTETEMFFSSIVSEDRNVLDLMTADYTYLNERVARHYGIKDVYGNHFRKVTLKDSARWGLLGKGSIQMISSHTDRTSPIVRGKWVLENVWGSPPPAPPPNIPPLPDAGGEGKVLSMRERMEMHRSSPVCASCHAMMDPIGYAMENFNAVGAWRDFELDGRITKIDASGRMLDGSLINGPVELRQSLMSQPDIFVSTVTEKLLVYALGRGIVATDMPVVRQIIRELNGDYRFSELVSKIVHSVPFQMRSSLQSESAQALSKQ